MPAHREEKDIEVVNWHLNPGATRPCWDFKLRERTVRLQGDGFYRDIKIREYTDCDIRHMAKPFPIMAVVMAAIVGLMLGSIPAFQIALECAAKSSP